MCEKKATEEREADVVIIGSGAGADFGREVSRNRKLKVILVEKEREGVEVKIGGKCFWFGCIKAKTFVKMVEEGVARGKTREEVIKEVKEHLEDAPKLLSRGLKKLLEANRNLEIIGGKARLVKLEGEKVVEVERLDGGVVRIRAKVLALAMGSVPLAWPALMADNKDNIIDSNGFFDMLSEGKSPVSIIGEGAGAIGMEFLVAFRMLGVKVDVVDLVDRIMPTEDSEISMAIAEYLQSGKAGIYTGYGVVENRVVEPGKEMLAKIAKGKEIKELTSEYILVALGTRRRALDVLESLGIEMARKPDGKAVGVRVDNNFETNIENVFVLGDQVATVNGYIQPMLRHMGTVGATIAARRVLRNFEENEEVKGLLRTKASDFGFDNGYRYMVAVTYFPGKDVGHVGQTNEELKGEIREELTKLDISGEVLEKKLEEEYGKRYREKRYSLKTFEEIGKLTWDEDCIKITEGREGDLVGVHILAFNGGELTSLAQLARKVEMKGEEFWRELVRVLKDVDAVSKKEGTTVEDGIVVRNEGGIIRVGEDVKKLREKAVEEGRKASDIIEIYAPFITNGRIVASVHDLSSEEVQKRLQDSKAGLIINKTTKKLLAGWATNNEFGLEVIKAILFAIRLELTVEQIEETIHAHPLMTELPYDIARRANTIIVDGQIRQAKKG